MNAYMHEHIYVVVLRHGTTRHGRAWHDTTRHGTARHSTTTARRENKQRFVISCCVLMVNAAFQLRRPEPVLVS